MPLGLPRAAGRPTTGRGGGSPQVVACRTRERARATLLSPALNPPVTQLVLGTAEGLAHETYFAIDEVPSVSRQLLREEIGLLGPDRDPELLEKLSNAWRLHRPAGVPTHW